MIEPAQPGNGHRARFDRSVVAPPLAILGVAAGLVLAFAKLAGEVMEGETSAIDLAVVLAFRMPGRPDDLVGPAWLQEMGRDVTALGSFAFLGFVFVAVAIYLLLVRKRAAAALMAAAVIGGAIVSSLLKIGFDRPRPDLASTARVFTASFPSGHATLSAVTFLTIGAILARVESEPRVKLYLVGVAVFLTVALGVSRIYLGLHYPTDVLARLVRGICVGAAVLVRGATAAKAGSS